MKNPILKIILGLVFFEILLIPSAVFLVFSNETSIMNNKCNITSDMKISPVICENSSNFLEGNLENLTISENDNLILENNSPLQPNWSRLSFFQRPSARCDHTMVYDSTHERIILFGGDYHWPGYSDETWTFNLETNTWTNLNPSTKPSARRFHAMAYDSLHDKIILFGGDDGSNTADTWAYDFENNTWTNMNPSIKPSARRNHAMVYDSVHENVILFGGYTGSVNDETWAYEFETNTWTNLNPITKPDAMSSHAMAYDSLYEKVILFGGGPGSNLDNTWAYDFENNTWTNMNPSIKPGGRVLSAMAYDSRHNKTILFGGGGVTDILKDLWAYDFETNTWTQLNALNGPTARRNHAMVYDSVYGNIILFGGLDVEDEDGYSDETWIFGFEVYQRGIFESKIISLTEINEISGTISWIPEYKTNGPKIMVQVGFSKTPNDEDFVYTSKYDSSFTFNGIGSHIRYRVYFESDTSLMITPILKSVNLTYTENPILNDNKSLLGYDSFLVFGIIFLISTLVIFRHRRLMKKGI